MAKKSPSGKSLAKVEVSDKLRVVIRVELYKGKKYLVIREQYKPDEDEDEWKFGRNGLNIPLKKLDEDDLKKLGRAIVKAGEVELEEDDEDEDDDDDKKKKKKKKDDDDDEDEDDDE